MKEVGYGDVLPGEFFDEDGLLHAFLAAVPQQGFSWQTFRDAAPSLVEAVTAVPSAQGGLYDFVKQRCVQAVAQRAADIAAAPRTRDRVVEGALAFFSLFATHPQALAVLMAAKPLGFQGLLWAVADEIWHQAGDTATDHNYYSKRFLLSQILLHTTLLINGSEGYDPLKVRAFLQRDIARVFAVIRPLSSLKSWVSGLKPFPLKTP